MILEAEKVLKGPQHDPEMDPKIAPTFAQTLSKNISFCGFPFFWAFEALGARLGSLLGLSKALLGGFWTTKT